MSVGLPENPHRPKQNVLHGDEFCQAVGLSERLQLGKLESVHAGRADVECLAGAYHCIEPPEDLLEGRQGIEAMDLIEIDIIGDTQRALCLDQGVGIIPYSPLARGLLAGSRRDNTERSRVVKDLSRPEDDAVIDRVFAVAKGRGCKPAQVALAWLLHNPAVTAPILGATKLHHVDDALAALEIQLTDQELDTFERAYRPQQVQHDRNEVIQSGHTAGIPPLRAALFDGRERCRS